MRKKKTNRQRMIAKLDKLASEVVRLRDGRCLLCGYTETLQVHHYIVTKGKSTKFRWDTRNLITLCYTCHLHKVHSTASIRFIDMVKKAAIINRIATAEEIEQIKNDFSIANFSAEELKEIEKNLLKQKEALNGKKQFYLTPKL